MSKPNKDKQSKVLDKLQDVTVIIPTFNRPKHLARLLNYYATKNTSLSYLILDGSNSEIAELNGKACKVLGNRVKHLVFPTTLPITIRIAEGMQSVNTPFCVFCADDDLVFVEGLAQALKYLEKHADYVCVDGIYLNFQQVEKDIRLSVEYSGTSIDANHPGARVFRLFQKYESVFYGLYRTSQSRDILTGMSKISSYHYQEQFQSTAALLLGKKHRLPLFYAARQSCEAADVSRDKWQSHYWFAENSREFLEYYLPYRDELWQFYEKHLKKPRLSKDAFNQAMDLAHAVFFAAGCSVDYFYSVLQMYWPDDAFQSMSKKNDICQQLKKRPHRIWDAYSERAFNLLQRKVSALFSRNNVKSLNRQIQKNTNTRWNCVLREDLRWLSKVDGFREAYQELCLYLDR